MAPLQIAYLGSFHGRMLLWAFLCWIPHSGFERVGGLASGFRVPVLGLTVLMSRLVGLDPPTAP